MTRQKLLDSARQVIASRGFEGASVELIAENAGFSKGAFYSNFGTKEEILLEVFGIHLQDELAKIEELLRNNPDFDILAKHIGNHYGQLVTSSQWCQLSTELQLHSGRNESFAKRFLLVQKEQLERITTLISGLLSILGRKDIPAAELSIGLLAFIQGLGLLKASGDRSLSAEQASSVIERFFRTMLIYG